MMNVERCYLLHAKIFKVAFFPSNFETIGVTLLEEVDVTYKQKDRQTERRITPL